jgi:uncharacterized protein (UPF0332 family)
VTPETGYFLDKARELLGDADAMLAIKLYDAAGRTACLAGFHAAQALISEKTDRSVKTHKGVNTELHRLTKDNPRVDPELRTFLARTYQLKAIADYETGPGSHVTPEQATDAIEAGRRFVAAISALLGA